MKYLGAVLLVLSGYVMAEEVYYCSDNTNGATGFWKNEKTGQYERSGFNERKFKMKLQDDGNIAIENSDRKSGKDLYLCSTPYKYFAPPELKNSKSCVDKSNSGYYFNFNPDNGRYIKFEGHGYVFSNNDTVTTRIGTCTKF
ncbi:MAG: hypothetical protein ABGY08_13775 [Gammaproteobacteria bacterium]